MRIQNNIMAVNTHRQYTINNEAISKSAEKLSSGYRINRAGDDAAGLAISEKMRAQIRGLNMATRNSQDAISMVQTAEGALQESHNILQRMRELSVQSASDTNETTIDRDALNKEYQQLIKELDDTAAKTLYNDMGLIDGTFSSNIMTNKFATAGADVKFGNTATSVVKSLWASTSSVSEGLNEQVYKITYSQKVVAATVAGTVSVTEVGTDTNAPKLSINGATVGVATISAQGGAKDSSVNGVWALGYDATSGMFTARNSSTGETRTAAAESIASGSNVVIDFGNIGKIQFDTATADFNPDAINNLTGSIVVHSSVTEQSVVKEDYLELNGESVKIEQGQKNVAFKNSGISIELKNSYVKNTTLGTTTVTVSRSQNQQFVVQTGANQGDTLALSIDKMDAYTLGVKTSNISNRLAAATAITQTNSAINIVSTQRAALGALQNRLDHKIANLKTSSENLQAAESRVRDVDMASEMTTFTKNNILSQAATAMLAQANSAPQNVLSLLR